MFVPKMNTKIDILLIEDDADDIELFEEALKTNLVPYSMNVVSEGDKVSDYMDNLTKYPQVIVLDFNLPRVHGRDVLRMIKSSERFKKIPLVVLTTSASKEDIAYSMGWGADHFITKPTSTEGFSNTVATIVASSKRPQ